VVGHGVEGRAQRSAKCCIVHLLVGRLVHAQQPLVAFGRADAKWQMPHAQARVAALPHVQRRAAEPSAEELEQAVFAAIQAFGVQAAQGPGLGQLVISS
jgi:hypothetical protein